MPSRQGQPNDVVGTPSKTTVILHVSPSFAMGGRELRVVELIGMMPKSVGVRHVICALDNRRETLSRVPEGQADIVEMEAPSFAGLGLWARLRRCRAILEEQQPDILLTYNWGSVEWLLAVRLFRLKIHVVHHEDGFGPDESERLLRRRNWIRRVALSPCDAVVVPSRTLEDIARIYWKQPAERLLYLPNGVDVERFRPSHRAERRAAVVFGCVGRVRPEKNQELAVAALAQMQDKTARLRVVGDGTELERVQALARSLGVAERVDFVGAVQDTSPEYRHFDVFVIPSRTEQMPLSLLEAMATRLPVVGTDVGDVAAMVAPENRAWIGDLHQASALASKMDELAADPGLRERLGVANRAKVESEFEREACYGAYVALYGELVGRDLAARESRDAS